MKVKLKPAEGRMVRDPVTREPLPELGAEKELTPFWRRRLADHDVLVIEEAAKKPAKEKVS